MAASSARRRVARSAQGKRGQRGHRVTKPEHHPRESGNLMRPPTQIDRQKKTEREKTTERETNNSRAEPRESGSTCEDEGSGEQCYPAGKKWGEPRREA